MPTRTRIDTRAFSRLHVWRDELGAGIIEYALLVSLIAAVWFFGVKVLGTDVKADFTHAGTQITGSQTTSRGHGG